MNNLNHNKMSLPCLVIGLLLSTIDTVYFLIFLISKYDNIWTLDGEYILRWGYFQEHLFQTAGGVLLLLAVCFIGVGMFGITRQRNTS